MLFTLLKICGVSCSRRAFISGYSLRAMFRSTLALAAVILPAFASTALGQQCSSEIGAGLCPGSPPPRIDLASMCGDNATTPAVIEFSWSYAASNPDGTSCGFFDSDGDGNANYAACSRSDGTQEQLFSCADTEPSRCPSFAVVNAPSLSCSSSAATVSCSINPGDLGGPSTVLSNVCSYTSNDGVDPNGT